MSRQRLQEPVASSPARSVRKRPGRPLQAGGLPHETAEYVTKYTISDILARMAGPLADARGSALSHERQRSGRCGIRD
jgi:hypothetical protein